VKRISLYFGKVKWFYLDGLMHICHYREVVSYFNLLKYLRENSKIREGNSFN
jgi:hypothetical protein